MKRPAAALTTDAKLYAVLTGDLIRSTALTADRLADARRVAETSAQALDETLAWDQVGELDFFRGDAWQLVLGRPGAALRAGLLIRARLRALAGVDTRIAIGVGGADRIDPGRVSRSTGEAFVLSGRTLDRMTSYFDLSGAVPEGAPEVERWLTLTLQLCGGLARNWTKRQAEVAARALGMANPTHEAIAQAFDIRKQSVTDILEAAHWRLLTEALKVFEDTDWRALVRTR